MTMKTDEFTRSVAAGAGLTLDQAERAVAYILRQLGARLPSPVVGQISAVLSIQDDATGSRDRVGTVIAPNGQSSPL